jgi:pyridoxamine 5'-phosphate oxidase
MWASLPANPHSQDSPTAAARNEPIYESDLLSFTTDARMPKVAQLFATAGDTDTLATQRRGGSSPGGPVEAVFWAKPAGMQWRFRGDAFVIGPDIEAAEGEVGEDSSGARAVKRRVGERMRRVREQSAGAPPWSWWREVAGHFDNLSPVMRGSFKNPMPGSPVGAGAGLGVGQKITGGLDEDAVAKENFRVIVIRPAEVEQLDLMDMEKARRWRYTFVGPGGGNREDASDRGETIGEWKVEELWP